MAEVISVRFKEVGKNYYFDPQQINFKRGDKVIVETARGLEFGEVTIGNRALFLFKHCLLFNYFLWHKNDKTRVINIISYIKPQNHAYKPYLNPHNLTVKPALFSSIFHPYINKFGTF